MPYPIVALVGYTNAGKSTLFNRLTGSDVLAQDMLFATLDPTMRSIELPGGPEAILSDTVGFISELPTQLVAAFRATLEEVLEADLILHVRDISHPETEHQAENVRSILADLGIDETAQESVIEVWNKIDLMPEDERGLVRASAARNESVLPISALTGEGADELLSLVAERLKASSFEDEVSVAFGDGRRRAWLFEHNLVQREVPTDDGLTLSVKWTEREKRQFQAL